MSARRPPPRRQNPRRAGMRIPRGSQRFARGGWHRGASRIGRVVVSPPGRHKDRSGKRAASAVIVILVEHGPFKVLVEFLALDFGRVGGLHLLPRLFP